MTTDTHPLLDRICSDLRLKFQVHTVLLYGSRANGTDGPDSDFDLAAFGPIAHAVREARVVEGHYLDAFVYPEQALASPTEGYLKLRGSKILLQRAGQATEFLAGLERIYAKGPAPLAQDELAARKVWARKMLVRIRRGDVEGNFRRTWLLSALLQDYFDFRCLWYEGPKRALLWLSVHDPQTFRAFELALSPAASLDAICTLVSEVVADGHA